MQVLFLAGVDGFEPPTVGVRVQCLTAWRYPNEQRYYTPKIEFVKRISQIFSVYIYYSAQFLPVTAK